MNKKTDMPGLPPGQFDLADFPRFGLTQFADRFPKETDRVELGIAGDVENPLSVSEVIRELPRVEQVSDFHCVTTWSHRSLRWGGVRFSDFFEKVVVPEAKPHADVSLVVFRSQDGYRVSLPLADLLAEDVLLADSLDGERLGIAHGAPLRLVAPAHYGYKNPKHLKGIEFWTDAREYRPSGFRFMDHARARVAFEERGRIAPGWFLRYLYRPLIRPTIKRFRRALDEHVNSKQN